MADPPLPPESDPADGGTVAANGSQTRPQTPRWVKVFGIIALVLVVLVILMLTGVLGKGHGPGRHLGGGRAMPHKNTGGVGGPAAANEASRTVEVGTLDTMRFEPAVIEVSAGETITFAVTNKGTAVHEFTLGDGAMQQQHAEMMAHIPAGMGHDTPNSVTIQPGETKQITWRVGGAATLEYACHERGHYEAGMRGRITIT